MKAQLNKIDSDATEVRVVDVHDFAASEDFASFERESIQTLGAEVVFCKIPAEDIASIHRMEALGFRFAEMQLTLRHKIIRPSDVSAYPYHCERVARAEDMQAALELAGTIFAHDRFTTDPRFAPGASARRYRAYVQKSFDEPDDSVRVVKSDTTGEVVSFGTVRHINAIESRLLIGGVANELRGSGMGVIHDHLLLKAHYDDGVRVLHTCVSAINYPIMNLEISHLQFRVMRSHLVLRKWYADL
jgi:hypothetical protein